MFSSDIQVTSKIWVTGWPERVGAGGGGATALKWQEGLALDKHCVSAGDPSPLCVLSHHTLTATLWSTRYYHPHFRGGNGTDEVTRGWKICPRSKSYMLEPAFEPRSWDARAQVLHGHPGLPLQHPLTKGQSFIQHKCSRASLVPRAQTQYLSLRGISFVILFDLGQITQLFSNSSSVK